MISKDDSVTALEMKEMDDYAIHDIGIPSIVLMERASLKVVSHLKTNALNSYLVISGTGNNGGDGVAVARHLLLLGKDVILAVVGDENKGAKDFISNLNIYRQLKGKEIRVASDKDIFDLEESFYKRDAVVDALFGIGLTRQIEGIYKEAIYLINLFEGLVVSCDIPSGLNADTGEPFGTAVHADVTVTFHRMKKGLLNNEKHAGKVVVEDIGIP